MSEWPYQVEVTMVGSRDLYFGRFTEWCAEHDVPFKSYDGLRNESGIRVAFKSSVLALQFQGEFGGAIMPPAELEKASEDDAFLDEDFELMAREIFGDENDEGEGGDGELRPN